MRDLDQDTKVWIVPGGLLFRTMRTNGITGGAAAALCFVPCTLEEARTFITVGWQ